MSAIATSGDAVDGLMLDDLFERESDILERLRHRLEGERFFMFQPLRALVDAGVRLGILGRHRS